MKYLKLYEQFRLIESTNNTSPSLLEPLAVAVLGAPAGGKSYLTKKLVDITKDSRLDRTLKSGVTLTVDILRAEFQSKNPVEQLTGFVQTFYLMKEKSKINPDEYTKWYNDIKNLWSGKFTQFLPDLKISVENEELFFGGKPALDNLSDLDKVDTKGLIDKLDKYVDYKRVVRYFQDMRQDDSIEKNLDVSYDEAGDEPTKIISNLDELHDNGYITDVFLIHPENVATNLIQNFYRVISGGDDGRDSSPSIIQAYLDIEKNKKIYSDNAEEIVKVKSSELAKASDALKKANSVDDVEKGDKTIDVFVEVQPMEPEEAFDVFSKKLLEGDGGSEKINIFIASLRYAKCMKSLPSNAVEKLDKLTKQMTNSESLKILSDAADSGKYNFKYGGINSAFVDKARTILI